MDTRVLNQQLPIWWSDTAGWNQSQMYSTIALADVDGDGRSELLGRGPQGMQISRFEPRYGGWMPAFEDAQGDWNPIPLGPPLADSAGFALPMLYQSIRTVDVNGDGQAEIVAYTSEGFVCWKMDKHTWQWTRVPSHAELTVPAPLLPISLATVRFADINGDGQPELLVLNGDEIVIWQVSKHGDGWMPLPPGPKFDSSLANLLIDPQYHNTIRYADIDDDGQAEMIFRYPGGTAVWKCDTAAHFKWVRLPDGPPLATPGWSGVGYYSTMRLVDLDGKRQAALLVRSPTGIRAWKCDPNTHLWQELPPGPPLADPGYDHERSNDTLQYADVDHDGRPELLVYTDDGIKIWRCEKDTYRWTQMPDGPAAIKASNGWSQPQYYLTVRCADIDGDHAAEIVARSSGGVLNWKIDPITHQWSEIDVPFPPFTGQQHLAYGRISSMILGSPHGNNGDIRSDYNDEGLKWGDISDSLDGESYKDVPADIHVSQEDWDAVRHQLSDEASYVQNINDLGDKLHDLIDDEFASNGAILDSVATTLEVSQKSSDTAQATIAGLFAQVVQQALGLAGLPGSLAGAALGKVINGAWGRGLEPMIEARYADLKNKLVAQYNICLDAVGDFKTNANTHWGQLGLIGQLVDNGILQWSDDTFTSAKNAASRAYTLWLWQTLTPMVWEIRYHWDQPSIPLVPGAAGDYPYPPPYAYVEYDPHPNEMYANPYDHYKTSWVGSKSGSSLNNLPKITLLENLFNAAPADLGRWVSTDSLGASVSDCMTSRNGWMLKSKVYVD